MNAGSNHSHARHSLLHWIAPVIVAACLANALHADSDTATPTYLRFGKTLDTQKRALDPRARWRYQRAFDKFPTLAACTDEVSNHAALLQPHLDWPNLKTTEQLRWCLFLVASDLKNPAKLASWFRANGFTARVHVVGPHVYRLFDRQEDYGIRVIGSIPAKQNPAGLSFWERWGTYSMSVGIEMTPEGEPLHVNVTMTRK